MAINIVRNTKLFIARLLDYLIPIKPGRMCFVTRANVPLSGNLRIMLDTMAKDPDLELGFFKEGPIPSDTAQALQAQNIRILQSWSLQSLRFLLSSQTIVLSHSARDAFITRRKRGRRVVNLWHGVALKRIERLMPRQGSRFMFQRRQALIQRNARIYDAMIASNTVDRLVNALAFGLPHHKVHAIGLPRFDYLQPGHPWPPDLKQQNEQLTQQLQGRALILYAPTFRDSGTTLADLLPPAARQAIQAFCQQTGTVFGIRTHPYRTHELEGLCDGQHILNLSPQIYAEGAVVLASTQALVVDYSSIWVDYLLLQRPVFAFVPDLDTYTQQDRGFIHDQPGIFPGPFCRTWRDTLDALSQTLRTGLSPALLQKHSQARTLLLPPDVSGPDISSTCAALIKGQNFVERTTPYAFSTTPAPNPAKQT
jgi:CDP-glycerol glycerophosphotransferase (TagB/SpsB family)